MYTVSALKSFDDTAFSLRIPDPDSCIFFDIECTGLKSSTSHLYLIGYAVKQKDGWMVSQLFAESPADEPLILRTFAQILRPYKRVVTFNGELFDIRYLNEKYDSYHMPSPLTEMENVDIYRELRTLRSFLRLSHMNQKSLEQFLGQNREDLYDGGELIQVYRDYVRTGNEVSKELTLLHNFEDICGMFTVTQLYAYLAIFRIQPAEVSLRIEPHTACFTFSAPCKVPRPVSRQNDYMELHTADTCCELKVSLFSGEALHFFDNYKDYYYLPSEDQAIHKDVAAYVDKAYRQRAKPENCYIRKQGHFLPEATACFTPVFRRMYKDPLYWFELTETLVEDPDFLSEYTEMLLQTLLRK